MKRFFKWMGIFTGGLVALVVLLIGGAVIYDKFTYEDPNSNVAVFRVEPSPGAAQIELVSARKHDGSGKVNAWRIYLRDKGAVTLPPFPLSAWDSDIAPRIQWKAPAEANICVDVKHGVIRFQVAPTVVTTTSPGGKFEGNLTNLKFRVNHDC